MEKGQAVVVAPEVWFNDIQWGLAPKVARDVEEVVLDGKMIERFELLDGRAMAHAVAKGEHEALLYMTLYVIWNNGLWRARHGSWEEYCDEWDKQPFGVSKSSIKHKVADVRKMLILGIKPATIIKALGNIPMAARRIAADMVGGDDKPIDLEIQKLPEGMTPDDYIAELVELGPNQAGLAFNDLMKRPLMMVEDAFYDADTKILLARLVYRADDDIRHEDAIIPNLSQWAGDFLVMRLKGR